jgi:hypothetical protein
MPVTEEQIKSASCNIDIRIDIVGSRVACPAFALDSD